jgi:hypothetical protein
MNEIEERIWSYIDGTCTPQEYQEIARLIEQDAAYRSKYEELLLFNAELQNLELDEPPMAFTYNVMETIRTEEARQPLKAAINKKIIGILTGIFVIPIVIMFIGFVCNLHFTTTYTAHDLTGMLKLPSLKNLVSAPVMKVFLFFDVLLGLALFDAYLRKRSLSKSA